MDESYEKPGPFKRFFFACAGSYIKILENCPSEHAKYVGIGATIFLTACMAVISGSFAIYTLVDNVPGAIAAGLLWGAMIFNLDRYIVSSIRKEGRTWYEVALAMPRIILAILISVVITKPIEVELFRNQLNSALYAYTAQLEKEAIVQLEDKLGLDSIYQEINLVDSMRVEYKKLKDGRPTGISFGEVSNEYNAAKTTYDSLYRIYNPRILSNETERNNLWNKHATRVYETDASGNKRFIRWDFPEQYQERTNVLIRANRDMQQTLNKQQALVTQLEKERKLMRESFAKGLDEEIALLQVKREELEVAKSAREKERDAQRGDALKTANRYGKGFPARIQALELLKEQDGSIWWMSNLIMMLFIMLETSPVFVKLITKRGPYDYLLSRIEHYKKVESLRSISDLNYDLNSALRFRQRQNGTPVRKPEEELYSDN
ncbi:MAG: DUF4407 domain-containing protein [Bacteroidia bacterium]|nr:DUF4407 domain-containing protein [Bacteroidia bacterium]